MIRYPSRHSAIFVAALLVLLATPLSLPAQATPAAPESTPPVRRERRPVVWNNADGKDRPGIAHHVLKSAAMEREVGYNVWLPPGYADNHLRYPVIYFLHGMGGNENSDGPGFSAILGKLVAQGAVPPAICVFPNGGASGYEDRPADKIMVETMIIRELIPEIDATYRTRAHRDSRMIAGFSMGARGSARLALIYPELFSATAGWGASLMGRNAGAPVPEEFSPASLKRTSDRVRILMIVGLDDSSLPGYARTAQMLTDAKYPFTYRTLENVGHNLGLYYQLTGEQVVRFLLEGVAPPSE